MNTDKIITEFQAITNKLVKMGCAKKKNYYHIREWIFARQRFWGEPIPIIHLEDGRDIAWGDFDIEEGLLPDADIAYAGYNKFGQNFKYSPLKFKKINNRGVPMNKKIKINNIEQIETDQLL